LITRFERMVELPDRHVLDHAPPKRLTCSTVMEVSCLKRGDPMIFRQDGLSALQSDEERCR
jgi:hypothetical protein